MKIERSKEWWMDKIANEGDAEVGAGYMPREHPLVKWLRDNAARRTKAADDPFAARKQTIEWKLAALLERWGWR